MGGTRRDAYRAVVTVGRRGLSPSRQIRMHLVNSVNRPVFGAPDAVGIFFKPRSHTTADPLRGQIERHTGRASRRIFAIRNYAIGTGALNEGAVCDNQPYYFIGAIV